MFEIMEISKCYYSFTFYVNNKWWFIVCFVHTLLLLSYFIYSLTFYAKKACCHMQQLKKIRRNCWYCLSPGSLTHHLSETCLCSTTSHGIYQKRKIFPSPHKCWTVSLESVVKIWQVFILISFIFHLHFACFRKHNPRVCDLPSCVGFTYGCRHHCPHYKIFRNQSWA